MTEKERTNRAWYIGADRDEVGRAAILVGDPARIARIAEHMTDVHFVAENRGLKTVTGTRDGQRITATAFGMGAPIATIVLHELHALGIRNFLRIGTAMAVAPAKLGDFVLADGALRAEGTSNTYAPLGFPAIADFDLNTKVRSLLKKRGKPWHAGIFGTYDGFYTEMFGLSGERRSIIETLKQDIQRLGLIGTDMETSALLTAARILGVRASTLCVATVDAFSQEKIADEQMAVLERDMFEIALDTMATMAAD
ncbi:nucleoside phosphorylase (plasmid) [Rhizobium lusitanum]|uniref:nucleoside phosphorylase n=1 Tax=Rhizobium lusitanum TaxID=293958 RepID=UPI0016212532|nr:nucleoside phosphorylase [Rhizobium lusitanum]QND46138.1 nucleoside phosphorylase [Rhizobium lusitanum]